jgi:DNA-binding transcriptional ArsR family regulator
MAASAQARFVYHQMMIVDEAVAEIAAAIGEPARSRMLFCLLDGHARTSTELALVGNVSPSTASVHLGKLKSERLVKVVVQGKHRYYSLAGAPVARALEGLSNLAGAPARNFVPNTPARLRTARTCYDHIAGTLGVSLHDGIIGLKWLARDAGDAYSLTHAGAKGMEALGIDVERMREVRRRFAYACLDWSERRPHIGGALGAALLAHATERRWVMRDLDSRSLEITPAGRREMRRLFAIEI